MTKITEQAGLWSILFYLREWLRQLQIWRFIRGLFDIFLLCFKQLFFLYNEKQKTKLEINL